MRIFTQTNRHLIFREKLLMREGKKRMIKYKENKNDHKLCRIKKLWCFKIVFLVKNVINNQVESWYLCTKYMNTHNTTVSYN